MIIHMDVKTRNREDLQHIAKFGAIVCKNIKSIYYENIAWVDCYLKVADKFTALKNRLRHNDQSELDFIIGLAKLCAEEIIIAMENVSHGTKA